MRRTRNIAAARRREQTRQVRRLKRRIDADVVLAQVEQSVGATGVVADAFKTAYDRRVATLRAVS